MNHRMSLFLLICIAGICNLISILPAAASDQKALLICVDRFQNKVLNESKAIPALKNDVIQLKSVLVTNGFDVMILDTTSKKKYRPTQRNILRMLSKLQKNTLSHQTLLVFFTGHGKGKYLLPYDFEPDFEYSGLKLSDMVQLIKNAGAGKKFFFLDACHSGRAIDGRFVKGAKDYTIDQTILGKRENQEEGFFTITSSRAEENSYVDEEGNISYFTKYLVKGLKGEADGFGRNNQPNCVVELPELHEYLEQSVSDAVIKDIRPKVNENVTQRPNILATGNLNTALIQLEKDACKGQPKPYPGRETIEEERNWEKSISFNSKSVVPETSFHPRGKPITISEKEIKKVFGLNDDWKSIHYFKNQFQDNGDGTISDIATGLMWQQDGSDSYMVFDNAQTYINGLNQNRFAGYSDWRLPTIPEFITLLEPEIEDKGLYIDPLFDTLYCCWSSDKVEKSSGAARYIFFGDGSIHSETESGIINLYVNDGSIEYNCYVRGVRIQTN